MPSTLSSNERDYLSEAKSFQQDQAPVMKRGRSVLALTAILFIMGLTGTAFSTGRYKHSTSTASSDGGGIRSSVTMDASLSSSVDLKYGSGFDKCVPASGSFDRSKEKENSDNPQNPFQSCYREYYTGENCWSKSYYYDGLWLSGWYECQPNGDGWYYIRGDEVQPVGTCGKPCQDMHKG